MDFSVGKVLSLLLLIIFLNLYIIYYVSAEGAPRKLDFSDEEKIVFTYIRQSLELKCPVEIPESDSNTFVDWYKDGDDLYMERGYETKDREGILKIKSVRKENAGIYTCEGVNGYGSVQVNITVIVDNPEIESTNSTPINPNSANRVNAYAPIIRRRNSKSVTDEVGGQATFHCVATGHPSPHIFWFKNGLLYSNVDTEVLKGRVHSTLKLRGLRYSDAGTYKCIARNLMGEDQTDFNLEVIETPKPPKIVSLEPAHAIISEGEGVIFWCEVNGKPEQKVHTKWFKRVNNEEIGNSVNLNDINLFRSGSTYYRPLNVTNGASTNTGVHKTNLLIRNSQKGDSGTYVCLALNDKGFSVKNCTLTVVRRVKFPGSSHPFYFSSIDTTFLITTVIVLAIILVTTVLISFLCYRSKSQRKARTRPATDAECANTKTTLAQKPPKDIYPELNDPQSNTKLLCPEIIYNYETQCQIAKSLRTTSSYH